MLRSQRTRWQRGLCTRACGLNIELMFDRKSGAVGWLAFPFMVLFEWLSPIVECLGWVYFGGGYLTGHVDVEARARVPARERRLRNTPVGESLLLDEISYDTYPRPQQIFVLLVTAVIENLGFRQMTASWRLVGLVQWVFGARQTWGHMKRSATWSSSMASSRASTLPRS